MNTYRYTLKFIVRRKTFYLSGAISNLRHLSKWFVSQDISHSIWDKITNKSILWYKKKGKVT